MSGIRLRRAQSGSSAGPLNDDAYEGEEQEEQRHEEYLQRKRAAQKRRKQLSSNDDDNDDDDDDDDSSKGVGVVEKMKKPRTDGKLREARDFQTRSNGNLRSGFRLHHTSCSDAAGSVFAVHNETINIWSHLLAFVACAALLVRDVVLYEEASHPSSWVLTLYLVAGCVLFAFSATYHTTKCISEAVHDKVIALDFAGIVAVISCSFVAGIYLGFHCYPWYRNLYLVVTAMINIPLFICSFLPLPLKLRKGLFLGAVLWCVLPSTHFFYLYDWKTNPLAHSMMLHTVVLLSIYGTAFVFYHWQIPESLSPGSFDIVASSHQIWHALIAVAVFYWYASMSSTLEHLGDDVCPWSSYL